MTTKTSEKPTAKAHVLKKLFTLVLLFAAILVSILVIRSIPAKESQFVDSVAGQIQQEMADNQIVITRKGGRRTVADFKDPIILAHGKDARLIVYTAQLSEIVSLADEGWGGFMWNWLFRRRERRRMLVTNGKVWYTPILKLKTVLKLEGLCEKNFPASGRC